MSIPGIRGRILDLDRISLKGLSRGAGMVTTPAFFIYATEKEYGQSYITDVITKQPITLPSGVTWNRDAKGVYLDFDGTSALEVPFYQPVRAGGKGIHVYMEYALARQSAKSLLSQYQASPLLESWELYCDTPSGTAFSLFKAGHFPTWSDTTSLGALGYMIQNSSWASCYHFYGEPISPYTSSVGQPSGVVGTGYAHPPVGFTNAPTPVTVPLVIGGRKATPTTFERMITGKVRCVIIWEVTTEICANPIIHTDFVRLWGTPNHLKYPIEPVFSEVWNYNYVTSFNTALSAYEPTTNPIVAGNHYRFNNTIAVALTSGAAISTGFPAKISGDPGINSITPGRLITAQVGTLLFRTVKGTVYRNPVNSTVMVNVIPYGIGINITEGNPNGGTYAIFYINPVVGMYSSSLGKRNIATFNGVMNYYSRFKFIGRWNVLNPTQVNPATRLYLTTFGNVHVSGGACFELNTKGNFVARGLTISNDTYVTGSLDYKSGYSVHYGDGSFRGCVFVSSSAYCHGVYGIIEDIGCSYNMSTKAQPFNFTPDGGLIDQIPTGGVLYVKNTGLDIFSGNGDLGCSHGTFYYEGNSLIGIGEGVNCGVAGNSTHPRVSGYYRNASPAKVYGINLSVISGNIGYPGSYLEAVGGVKCFFYNKVAGVKTLRVRFTGTPLPLTSTYTTFNMYIKGLIPDVNGKLVGYRYPSKQEILSSPITWTVDVNAWTRVGVGVQDGYYKDYPIPYCGIGWCRFEFVGYNYLIVDPIFEVF